MDLIKSKGGILYPSPSKEIDPIVLEGDGWVAIIEYHGYHPMLPKELEWRYRVYGKD